MSKQQIKPAGYEIWTARGIVTFDQREMADIIWLVAGAYHGGRPQLLPLLALWVDMAMKPSGTFEITPEAHAVTLGVMGDSLDRLMAENCDVTEERDTWLKLNCQPREKHDQRQPQQPQQGHVYPGARRRRHKGRQGEG